MCNGVKEIIIHSYDELVNIIKGRDKIHTNDLREDFIFRGLSNIEYGLIPSSLRKNKLNELEINEFIESDYVFNVSIDENEAKKNNLVYTNLICDDKVAIAVNKYGNLILNVNSNYEVQECDLQIEREKYILLKFLNYADKSGLKVKTEGMLRHLLHHILKEPFNEYNMEFDILEIMSLAQHYGLPTKALDWSYDYKVALYFVVRDILESNHNSDGVLWALNYKLIENPKFDDIEYYVNLHIYRPEYSTNPNLNAQKGLFTFLERYVGDYDKPLNEIISLELNQTPENRPFDTLYESKITTIPINISKEDIIFYKFIIPKELKAEILKELYLEGYSEEYLFPGYNGVSKSIINRVKLNNLFKNRNKKTKKNILLVVDWDLEDVKNKNKLYEFIKFDFRWEIDKIFVYLNNEIIGFFRGNEIIKDSFKNLLEKYGDKTILSQEKFDNYSKDTDECFAIRINDLNVFEYPIKLKNFEFKQEFYFIEDYAELRFLLNFD